MDKEMTTFTIIRTGPNIIQWNTGEVWWCSDATLLNLKMRFKWTE